MISDRWNRIVNRGRRFGKPDGAAAVRHDTVARGTLLEDVIGRHLLKHATAIGVKNEAVSSRSDSVVCTLIGEIEKAHF